MSICVVSRKKGSDVSSINGFIFLYSGADVRKFLKYDTHVTPLVGLQYPALNTTAAIETVISYINFLAQSLSYQISFC